jgi:actin related protein 2/3 complex subunit 2
MIILEFANRIVHETIMMRLRSADKPYGVEMKCADFDGVMFHVFTTPGNKSELNVSIGFASADDCLRYGGDSTLNEIYEGAVVDPEPLFNATLRFNLDALPWSHEEFAQRVSLLKSHVFCAPIYHVIRGPVGGEIDIPYRSTEERLYMKKDANDRVTCVFSVVFKDPDDIVLGTVFLKEFKKSVGGAPTVDFTNGEPPLELRGKTIPRASNVGYVTFVLFDRHISPQKSKQTVEVLQTFRNYLHYHIKCAKSHLHTCMRIRVELLLKILNRAKQDLPKEKKTIKGKTFQRKGAKN